MDPALPAVENLLEACFRKMRLSDITSDVIEDFKQKGLSAGPV